MEGDGRPGVVGHPPPRGVRRSGVRPLRVGRPVGGDRLFGGAGPAAAHRHHLGPGGRDLDGTRPFPGVNVPSGTDRREFTAAVSFGDAHLDVVEGGRGTGELVRPARSGHSWRAST